MTGRGISFFVLGLVAVMWSSVATAQQFDETLAWPLCGRITESPPAGWVETDGCPAERWGNPDFSDLSLSSTFGPRPLASQNDRYDFHRGLDIASPVGTPVFAIADGVVRIAGVHSSYDDPLVQIRHYRPGYSSCNGVGCYHSNFLHLSDWAVSAGQTVNKGDLVGFTGISGSGFAHLHFEIRDAPPADPTSSWQRDTISPMGVLPYSDPTAPVISFDSVDTADPLAPVAQVTVTASRVDINRVELFLYDSGSLLVPQAGNTPNAKGYNVYPSWFDMNEWNKQYTHKNSTSVPWESYGQGGENECPFYLEHGASYSANVHMDAQDFSDFHVGHFNGLTIRTADYTAGNYYLNLTFNELAGPAQCIVAKASMLTGGKATQQWGDCSGLAAPVADSQQLATPVDTPLNITLTGSDDNNDVLSYSVVSQPANGTLSGEAPNLIYTPDPGTSGSDSFAFTVNDGTTDSASAFIDITVGSNPTNNAPVASADNAITNEDSAVSITVLGNDNDADGDSLTVVSVTQGANGAVGINFDNSLVYTPNINFNGNDSFNYTISDGQGGTDTAVVTVTVNPVNDSPVADDQSVVTNKNTAVDIALTGSDPDGDVLSFGIVTGPAHGILSGAGASQTYTPDANYTGADAFTFSVNDGNGGSATATVSINVKKGRGGGKPNNGGGGKPQ